LIFGYFLDVSIASVLLEADVLEPTVLEEFLIRAGGN
jgi:hypothetical protein